jgi:hypothetical protein
MTKFTNVAIAHRGARGGRQAASYTAQELRKNMVGGGGMLPTKKNEKIFFIARGGGAKACVYTRPANHTILHSTSIPSISSISLTL